MNKIFIYYYIISIILNNTILALHWQVTWSDNNNKEEFKIHGLWPKTKNSIQENENLKKKKADHNKKKKLITTKKKKLITTKKKELITKKKKSLPQ